MTAGDPRSRLPSIDRLLAAPGVEALVARFGRAPVVEAARAVVDAARDELRSGNGTAEGGARDPGWADRIASRLAERDRPSLRPVVNATGVVIHTNLGRAPLAAAALDAMRSAAAYSNLEYDLEEGRRGSRYTHCTELLRELTGAEDGLVVNNAAAGLVLALNTLALGAGVAVSRGELVEIGGGFRIPEMLERAGARLVEVGSTNRTRVADYRAALDAGGVAAVLKVHRSNFRITGFTEEASLEELRAAAPPGVPLVYDLGSGLLADPAGLGLPPEPGPRGAIRDGAELVVFSGDKLLGGPQAGIVVGRAELVARLRRNPLCRALRVDKATLAALEATLRLYRDPARALREIPVLAMLSASPERVHARARVLAGRLEAAGVPAEVVETRGAVGGGTYPGVEIPGWAVAPGLPLAPDAAAALLRAGDPAVVARVADARLLLEMRTVLEDEEDALAERVLALAAGDRAP